MIASVFSMCRFGVGLTRSEIDEPALLIDDGRVPDRCAGGAVIGLAVLAVPDRLGVRHRVVAPLLVAGLGIERQHIAVVGAAQHLVVAGGGDLELGHRNDDAVLEDHRRAGGHRVGVGAHGLGPERLAGLGVDGVDGGIEAGEDQHRRAIRHRAVGRAGAQRGAARRGVDPFEAGLRAGQVDGVHLARCGDRDEQRRADDGALAAHFSDVGEAH